MRYDTILFDLDGTLIASAPGIFASVRYALDAMGIPCPPEETLYQFMGPPMYDSLRRHCGLSGDTLAQAVSIYRKHNTETGQYEASVFTGVPSLLRALKEKGVYLAVATAKPVALAREVLSHFGISRFFDKIVGAQTEDRDPGKDEILAQALPPRYGRAAMVGDRRYDMEAAKHVGIDAIGAGWGYGTEAELLSSGADVVCGSVADLGRLLLGQEMHTPRGFFISIEGIDGSGKSTQATEIARHIGALGYDVLVTREPGGTPISEAIRSLVLDPDRIVCAETEALLYAAARAQHVSDVIRPALQAGRVVLCDRFVDSSIVYQGAGRELGIDQVSAINRFAIGDTLPDLTILLAMDPRNALLRRNSATALDRLERAGEAFFRRVFKAYAQLARTYPDRIRPVDAEQDVQSVTAAVLREVDRLLASR